MHRRQEAHYLQVASIEISHVDTAERFITGSASEGGTDARKTFLD